MKVRTKQNQKEQSMTALFVYTVSYNINNSKNAHRSHLHIFIRFV